MQFMAQLGGILGPLELSYGCCVDNCPDVGVTLVPVHDPISLAGLTGNF